MDQAYAMMTASTDAFRLAGKAFKTNMPTDPLTKLEMSKIGRDDFDLNFGDSMFGKSFSNAIKYYGNVVTVPGRALMAEDEFFKAIGFKSELAALVGKPMKAFIYQDHEAHITAHMAMMQDPAIAQMIGQNPQAQQIMAALQAHIAEHLAFSYRKKIEEQLGAPLPAPDEELPEEIEVQLSRLVAQAGQQLTQQHQQEAAQQQAQQQAQDPLFQLEQAKLQTQQAEVQRKAAKDQADMKIAAAKLALEDKRIGVEAQKEGMRLQSQEKQNNNRLKIDALKTLATPPKQQAEPAKKKSKED